VLEGLLIRRRKEARLYTTGDYGDGKPAATEHDDTPAHAATEVPNPVPPWAWHWVEWKLGRAAYKGHAGDPALRKKTGAPDTIPAWGWTFLQRFQ
jgi:hypothetical protein